MKFVFDIDDTLYDLMEPFRKAFLDTFKNFDVDIQTVFIKSREHSDLVFEQSMKGEISIEDMYVYRITHALNDVGKIINRDQALMFQKAYAYYQAHIELNPIIIEILNDLSNQNRLAGCITNGLSHHQKNKAKTLGLNKWFKDKQIIVSGDFNVNKPDKALFEIAEIQLNLKDEKVYFIGDSFENDVIGAWSIDWIPIWLNVRNKEMPEHSKSIIEVKSYKALNQLVKELCETGDF